MFKKFTSSIMERSTQVNGGFGLTAPPEPEALFSETLCYNEPSYGNTPRYAGDIATMAWKADAKNRVYNFTYDGFSRLTRADYLEDNIVSANYTTTYTYDRMGNMLTLRRSGLHDNGIFGLLTT